MKINFDNNIERINYTGFNETKKPDFSNEFSPSISDFSDRGISRAYFMGGLSFKGKTIKFDLNSVKELSDVEFEIKKQDIQKRIDELPQEAKKKFNDIRFNKYNIFVAEKILDNPELFEKGAFKNELWGIMDRGRTKDGAQAQCGVIDMVMKSKYLKNNQDVMEQMGNIIFMTDSTDSLIAKSSMVNVIMENEDNLKNNQNVQDMLGRIILTTSNSDCVLARCDIIEKIMGNEKFKYNENILKRMGSIIYRITSLNDALEKKRVLYGIQGIVHLLDEDELDDLKECLGDILVNAKEDQMQFIEKMLNSKAFPNILIGTMLKYGKKFYRENRNKTIEVYEMNKDKIREMYKNGYEITIKELQGVHNVNIFLTKNEKSNNGTNKPSEIKRIARFSQDGKGPESICELFKLKKNVTLERTTTSDNKYTCDSYYEKDSDGRKVLKKEIRVIYGKKGPLYVQKTVASPVMKEVFDTTVYNLAQSGKDVEGILKGTNNSTEILERIEMLGIKGWDFSKTFQTPKGEKIHIERCQKWNLHTKRIYTENYNETKTSLDYTISDTKGKKLLDVHRTFELNGNKSISTLNGKEYIAEFDNENMKARIGDVEIDFKEKMKDETSENKEKLWGLIKKTPGDLLLHFSNVKEIKYRRDNGSWSFDNKLIKSENSLGTISHELGHCMDSMGNEPQKEVEEDELEENYKLSRNPELIRIYTEEIEDFKRNVSETEQENIKYFSQNGGTENTGLSEVVAEVNMLCTTQKNLNLQTRAFYLTRYFPRTISAAAKLLGYSAE